EITGAGRHGKFLDLVITPADGVPVASGPAGELHLITHLARAGWLRWRDDLPDKPPRPGKSPLAFRLRLEGGSGFDLTEAGTRKRLAVYLVEDPAQVPGIASPGPDPPDRGQAAGRPPDVAATEVVPVSTSGRSAPCWRQ